MKKNYLLLIIFLMVFVTMGCSDDENTKDNALISYAKTGCKPASSRVADDATDIFGKEVITYQGTSDKCLIIKHINVMFGCDADISVTASINNRVITIAEHHTSSTNCICPYDLTVKVGFLTDGEYTVVIDNGSSDKISFSINYSSKVNGEYFQRIEGTG